MNSENIYARTEIGETALASNPDKLPSGLLKVLSLVDGRINVAGILAQLTDVPAKKVHGALKTLLEKGYVAAAPGAVGDDLDFTNYLDSATPVPQPTPEETARAKERTLSGMRALDPSGHFVNIVSKPQTVIPPRSGDKYCALIVDGDATTSLLTARTLMLAGFTVHTAENREQFTRELGRQPLPDILLLDVMMPGLPGFELVSRLRQNPKLKSLPVVLITARAEQSDVINGLARGANGYLSKPYRPNALVESVHSVLGITPAPAA